MTITSRHPLVLAAVLGVGALTLTGCSVLEELFPVQAERDTETQEIQAAGEADIFLMSVGDCIDDQAASEFDSVPAVPCGDPHDMEVYHAFDIQDGTFPGDEVIAAAADEGCYAAFAPFIGLAYEESAIEYTVYTPTSGSWAAGDREILCLVYEDGKTTGTLAGSAR